MTLAADVTWFSPISFLIYSEYLWIFFRNCFDQAWGAFVEGFEICKYLDYDICIFVQVYLKICWLYFIFPPTTAQPWCSNLWELSSACHMQHRSICDNIFGNKYLSYLCRCAFSPIFTMLNTGIALKLFIVYYKCELFCNLIYLTLQSCFEKPFDHHI